MCLLAVRIIAAGRGRRRHLRGHLAAGALHPAAHAGPLRHAVHTTAGMPRQQQHGPAVGRSQDNSCGRGPLMCPGPPVAPAAGRHLRAGLTPLSTCGRRGSGSGMQPSGWRTCGGRAGCSHQVGSPSVLPALGRHPCPPPVSVPCCWVRWVYARWQQGLTCQQV